MKCVICLSVFNISQYINNIIDNINQISQLFDNIVTVFSCSNRSTDNTIKFLEEKQQQYKNLNINILICYEDKIVYRTHRIAKSRNMYLEFIYKYHFDSDYFIVMDGDNVCSSKIKIDILYKHLKSNHQWDALSFNRVNYYDMWALLYHPLIIPVRNYSSKRFSRTEKLYICIKNEFIRKLNQLDDSDLFDCYSAFNGFCIYKTDKFINCKYIGCFKQYLNNLLFNYKINESIDYLRTKYNIPELSLYYKQQEICEHVNFHLEAYHKNSARIRISKDILFP